MTIPVSSLPLAMKTPDRIDVARQAMGQVLSHPVTWAPFLPVAAAFAFLGAAWWLCLVVAMAVAVVVFLAWSHYWPRLVAVTRARVLSTHRATEDKELAARVQRLALSPQRLSSLETLAALREATAIKRSIEDRVHADGVVTDHEAEVSAMVGDLVRTMVEEAERLMGTDGGGMSPTTAGRFDKAAATLRQVYSEIDVVLDPVPEDLRVPAGDDALSRASERLDERLKLARGIRRHLERDLPLPEAAEDARVSRSPESPKQPE